MRTSTRALALSLVVFALTRPASAAERRVVLISIDGMSPYFYLDPDAYDLRLPNLERLRDDGVAAEGVVGVYPSVTYPSHTTLVTGVLPAEHGIVTNTKVDDWYLDSADVRVPTLWDAASGAGLTTAIVTWPASYGAKVDFLIPENLGSHDDLLDRVRAGSTPGLFEELEVASGITPRMMPFSHPDAGVPLDELTAAFASALIRTKQPDFIALHFLDLDHRRHGSGPFSPEARRALELIDGHVGDVVAAVAEAGLTASTTFVIVSDHGFVATHTGVNLAMIQRRMAELAPRIRFRNSGGSAGAYVQGAGQEEAAQRRLHSILELELGGRARFVSRDALEALGGYPDAFGAIEAEDGYVLVDEPGSEELLVPTDTLGSHGYLPTNPRLLASFIMTGAGVAERQRGHRIPPIQMIDVAPTLAALLGVELPAAQGRALVGLVAR
jgi:predicted AlkP superfamily pyrophosphatase or phosphodiesterase